MVLGDIALLHPGRMLMWDAKNMRITSDDAAHKSHPGASQARLSLT